MAHVRRLLSETAFAAEAKKGAARGATVYRLAQAGAVSDTDAESRCIPYVFSTGGVARDGHTINQSGWKLENFRANPVLLWAHDASSPPIGKILDINTRNGYLAGIAQYADAETYAQADTVFRLVKRGFINAMSVAWNPLKWSLSKDRNRPNGIDFQEQELLEVSQVPVPADTGALATARAAGINIAPLARWAERALDLRTPLPIDRRQLEDLYKEARQPTPRSVAAMTSTRAEREARLRQAAYAGIALGCGVPAGVWPPQTRAEREAVAAGKVARAKAERPL